MPNDFGKLKIFQISRKMKARASFRAQLPLLACFCVLSTILTGLTATPASAGNKAADLVVDANTGNVLYARFADAPRYPASLTKMMTLYMVFERLKDGRLSYSTPIRMTANAAGRPPSKLGLPPGRTILLRDAIKALVTKSANDVAAAVGEHIAGSEWQFANLMTQRAHQIGMTSTRFKNASGLTAEGQLTTARDMITLALRLHDEFPKEFALFSTKAFYYGGKTYRNHNTLLRSMRGVDGIKTGYTRASGFNVVTSMHHDGKHVVAAVFGGKTAGSRNARMRSLLYRSMKKASKRKSRRPPPMLIARPQPAERSAVRVAMRTPAPPPIKRSDAGIAAATPPSSPPPRPFRPMHSGGAIQQAQQPGPVQPAPFPPVDMVRAKTVSVLTPSAPASHPVQHQRRTQFAAASAFGRAPLSEPAPTPQPRYNIAAAPPAVASRGRPPSTLNAQAAQLSSLTTLGSGLAKFEGRSALNGPRPAPQPLQAAYTAPRTTGDYHIQVGALPSSQDAQRHANTVRTRAGHMLAGYQPLTIPVDVRGKQMWRVRFAGFASSDATRTCNELRRSNIDCFVTRP